MTDHFVFAPNAVFQDDRLSKIQIRVLLALFSFRDAKTTNVVFPHRQTIADRCGYSVHTISVATSQLEALGWLTKTGDGGRRKSTQYELHVPDEALNGDLFGNRSGSGNGSGSENGSRSGNGSRSATENGDGSGTETVPDPERGICELTKNISGTNFSGASAPEEKNGIETPEGVDPSDWGNLVEYRKSIGSPLTPESARAVAALILDIPPAQRRTAVNLTVASGGKYLAPMPSMFHEKQSGAGGMPRDNAELVGWAQRNGLPAPYRGESFPDYRQRLARLRSERQQGVACG